jgi:NTP pyrophosphatase (non-canonical NTP hydrolase)
MNGKNMDGPTEALVILAEECCEVGQIVAKILRWGIDSTNQGALDASNREHLIKEIGDVVAMIQITKEQLGIDDAQISEAAANKLSRLGRWSQNF